MLVERSLVGGRTARMLLRGRALALLSVVAVSSADPVLAQSGSSRADSLSRVAVQRALADSQAARLERAEAAIALLRQQLAVEATTAVRTQSRVQIDLSARILMNTFVSSGSLNSADVPTFVSRDDGVGGSGATASRAERTLGLSLRQSRLGLAVNLDSVLGARFSADVELDLFGGGAAVSGDLYQFPEPRLRTAVLRMQWPRTELLVGSDSPLISDLNPITLASVGEPGFANAGNLWNWLPQFRVTRTLAATTVRATRVEWALQAALLQPASPEQAIVGEYPVSAASRSGRPYVHGRTRVRWQRVNGTDAGGLTAARPDESGEIGVGVHTGWLRLGGDTLTTSRAVSVDARIGFGHGIELRGEGYRGRTLSGLGGGAIEQTLGSPASGEAAGVPLRDAGAWAQLNWQATPVLMLGAGCGVDRVEPGDRPERLRNAVCATHTLWRPAQPLVIGIEFRELRTTYADRMMRGRHVNIAIGFEL